MGQAVRGYESGGRTKHGKKGACLSLTIRSSTKCSTLERAHALFLSWTSGIHSCRRTNAFSNEHQRTRCKDIRRCFVRICASCARLCVCRPGLWSILLLQKPNSENIALWGTPGCTRRERRKFGCGLWSAGALCGVWCVDERRKKSTHHPAIKFRSAVAANRHVVLYKLGSSERRIKGASKGRVGES